MLNEGRMMSHGEQQYLNILAKLVQPRKAVHREGRNGGTFGIFGEPQMVFDLQEGFPLLTTKRLYTRAIIVELLWFLRGMTNTKWLKDQKVDIWDEWADKDGNLGPVYGAQWRSWAGRDEEVDQIYKLIERLKKDPYSRRHIVTAWNPAEVDDMALPPCHCLFQFNVRPMSLQDRVIEFGNRQGGNDFELEGNEEHYEKLCDEDNIPKYFLDCKLYQRSADWFLGVPFNIASYAALTHIIGREVNMLPSKFIHTFGDAHLYATHIEQALEQLTREPYPFPKLIIDQNVPELRFDQLEFEHFSIENYTAHPNIKAEVSK